MASRFDALFGLEMLESDEGHARACVRVNSCVTQPGGVVHGGVYAAIAQSLAEEATWVGLTPEARGTLVVLTNHTTLLRPVGAGTLHAEGECMHRGRSTWVWRLGCSDDDGRLCSSSMVTVSTGDS